MFIVFEILHRMILVPIAFLYGLGSRRMAVEKKLGQNRNIADRKLKLNLSITLTLLWPSGLKCWVRDPTCVCSIHARSQFFVFVVLVEFF